MTGKQLLVGMVGMASAVAAAVAPPAMADGGAARRDAPAPVRVVGGGSSAPSENGTVPAAPSSPAADPTLPGTDPALPGAAPALPAGKVFLGGPPATFSYSVTGSPPAGARVELYRAADGQAVRSWPLTPGGQVQWNGHLGTRDAPNGRYGFRLIGAGAAVARAATAGGTGTEFDLLDHLFPIRGKHDLGQSATNGFGGGRGHQGQDMFASCGTPVVAARGGTVTKATFDSRSGNYVVITDDTGQSNVYMHMRKRPLVAQGDRVVTGQQVGEVGETGRATGCHLHFELWTAPGWYQGGKAVNPLPQLRRWDRLTGHF